MEGSTITPDIDIDDLSITFLYMDGLAAWCKVKPTKNIE